MPQALGFGLLLEGPLASATLDGEAAVYEEKEIEGFGHEVNSYEIKYSAATVRTHSEKDFL